MGWLQKALESWSGGSRGPSGPVTGEIRRTFNTMSRTFDYAVSSLDTELHVLEHSARVGIVVGWLGQQLGMRESDVYLLRTAAQLHEVGMFTVPKELLARRAHLSTEELQRVRRQAEVSAELARAAHHPAVPLLVETQYTDHKELEASGRMGPRELLLAGVFRVADVLVAVTWPRPYQDPLSWEACVEVLRSGAGSRFHPLVVQGAARA